MIECVPQPQEYYFEGDNGQLNSCKKFITRENTSTSWFTVAKELQCKT